ncbi:MAG: IPT/TIG domain-containing protein [Terriglobia bacterium]
MLRRIRRWCDENANRPRMRRESASLRNQSLLATMCVVVAVLLAAPANSSGQTLSITSIDPTSTTAGGPPFTLNVDGTGFDSTAVVDWNGSPLSTQVESNTLLRTAVTADLIATAGTATVTVSDNGATSNGVTFNIVPPAPVISSLNPSSALAGGNGFTLTVNGSNFDSSASVQWNGTGLSTSFVSAGQLTATVTADLIASAGAATVTVADNGQTSNGATFTIIAPPIITSISPNAVSAGGPVFTLTVIGTGFDSMGTVLWNGSPLPTNFVNKTQLTATVAPSLISSPGTALVTVSDNGATSNSATFTIAPVPAITFLSPSSAAAGQAGFTLTVNGTGFVSGAVVQWNSTALTTTFVSATQLTAPVAASAVANAGSATVTVTEDGVTSNGATFTIAALTITSLSPNTATAGQSSFTLTVNGTEFVSGAVVQWNSTALTTTFVSATQLTAPVAASLVATAGSATITVTENGVTSASATFTINTGPAITSLIPSSATVGQASFTLTVIGTGFVSGAVVQWNSTALTTTFVSATQLTAPVAANLVATAGSVTITVTENGVTSTGATFTINTGPAITSLSPSSATAGQGGFTLTVNGTGFISGAVVLWNSTALTTTFVSATQLTAPVAASLVASAGSVTVAVTENGVTSAGATFTIAPGAAITSLSPNTATAGGTAFTLSVNGAGFLSTAVVEWNGSALSTTFVSATQLTAMVAASLISTPGSASVTVVENGLASAAATFTIVAGPAITSLSPTFAVPHICEGKLSSLLV